MPCGTPTAPTGFADLERACDARATGTVGLAISLRWPAYLAPSCGAVRLSSKYGRGKTWEVRDSRRDALQRRPESACPNRDHGRAAQDWSVPEPTSGNRAAEGTGCRRALAEYRFHQPGETYK